MVRVLALDVATATGWCTDGPSGGKPLFGTFRIHHEGDDLGDAYVEYNQRLRWLIQEHKPDKLIFEAPLPRGGKGAFRGDSAAAARKLMGLAAMTEFVGCSLELDVWEVSISEIRRHFVGDGSADKEHVWKMCRLLGWNPQTYDESDAGAVWSHGKSLFDRSFSYATTPLFGGARA